MGTFPVSGGVENRLFYGEFGLATPAFEENPALPTGQTKEQGTDVAGDVNQAFTAPFGFLNLIAPPKDNKGRILLVVIVVVAAVLLVKK